ncbi:hypothetical protein AJ79_07167 [Helicocarpus griseus UAMH5409]|uniref:Uncharacterized protein n=1 Tax=Helicocarpus griseus UAMH5409 TaxID=1447875 RepID=A0A2B7X5M0_9EURO|nr:hypothetical protein AJ79_07167 [Helicocarpus griseus UAMH5409]
MCPWLKWPCWGTWRGEEEAVGWPAGDEGRDEEMLASEEEVVCCSKEQLPTQSTMTPQWVSYWARDVGFPAAQVSSYWMSGNLAQSNSMASLDDARSSNGEGCIDWMPVECCREITSSSVVMDDDALPERVDVFLAHGHREGGILPAVMAGSDQSWEGLYPVDGLRSLSLSDDNDVEMTGCEPVGEPEVEMMDWEGADPSMQRGPSAPGQPGVSELQKGHELPLGTPVPPPVGRTREQEAEGVNFLFEVARDRPQLWEILVGVYFAEGRNPRAHLGHDQEAVEVLAGEDWEWNWTLQDMRERCPGRYPGPYSMPSGPEGDFLELIARTILNGNEDLFVRAIKRWQLELMAHDRSALETILFRAGWCRNVASTREWQLMADIKSLPEGPQRNALLRQAFQELPRFASRCMSDPVCCRLVFIVLISTPC